MTNLRYSTVAKRNALALAVLISYLASSYWYETLTPQTPIHASSKPTSQGNGPEVQIITERGVLTNR